MKDFPHLQRNPTKLSFVACPVHGKAEKIAVVNPFSSMCFCLGSGPFCLSGLLFLLTKRKSGWGICGSSGWCVVWFVVICLHFLTVLVLVQIDVLLLMLM